MIKKVITWILLLLIIYFLLTHINIGGGYSSLDKQYNGVNRALFMVNEAVIDYFWGNEEIYGRGGQRFTKEEDDSGINFYISGKGFINIVQTVIYNPKSADIKFRCNQREVLDCRCFEMGRCQIVGHD